MSNEEQIEYWNGEAGQRWAEQDAMMARLLQPVCEALLAHVDVSGSRNAMDIGCGGGSQSLLLAQRLGAGARVLGVDISGPMLAIAEDKVAMSGAEDATLGFLKADASNYTFEPGSFDLLFSRFGVMFFEDPSAAFSNVRSALKPGGRLAFACWQEVRKNAFFFEPMAAVAGLVEMPPPAEPGAPGPFAFADPDRAVIRELGLETLPAIVHLDHGLQVLGAAEGWNPAEWREVASGLADHMSWTRPAIPTAGDPTPYAGTPALG